MVLSRPLSSFQTGELHRKQRATLHNLFHAFALTKYDRLSRSLQDLLSIVEAIRGKGAGFRSLAEDIDTTTPAGRLVFHVFASIAQFERERISERTKEGLTAARKRGRVGGRPTVLSSERRAEVTRMRDQEGRGIAELARLFEVSPNTIRRA